MLKTFSLSDPMLDVNIEGPNLEMFTVLQNSKSKSLLSCLKETLASVSSACPLFSCYCASLRATCREQRNRYPSGVKSKPSAFTF